jgi:hypothetical protein
MCGSAARIMIRNYYNGLTKEEMGEVLLQTGVYCGIAPPHRTASELRRRRLGNAACKGV